MSGLTAALWVEIFKVRRSRVPWLTAMGFSLAPLVGGLFMLILKDPERARHLGLITTKAEITTGSADWPTYFDLLAQAVAVGGLIIFGLIASWVFGREFADRTLTDMLAVPAPRSAIVVAKFLVITGWSFLLSTIVYGLGVGVGMLVDIPGWSSDLMIESFGKGMVVTGLTVALVTPFAWVASAGRGYLPAIGVIFLALFLAQVVAALGWGGFFPWSTPALISGVAGSATPSVGVTSYLLVMLTGIVGMAGTIIWWWQADHT